MQVTDIKGKCLYGNHFMDDKSRDFAMDQRKEFKWAISNRDKYANINIE